MAVKITRLNKTMMSLEVKHNNIFKTKTVLCNLANRSTPRKLPRQNDNLFISKFC